MFMRRACLGLGATLFAMAALAAVDPFADHNGQLPPPSDYAGPLFKLSYHYPSGLPAPAMPWRAAIANGRIGTHNAAAYTAALKDAIGADMRALLDYAQWNAAQRGWYNDPWMGSQREPIHGLLVGVESVDNSLFPKSALARPFTYATETLGWGGRLSGPNDHALNDISFVLDGKRRLFRNARNSSCLSCHGTSQWVVNDPAKGMASFLMPLAPSPSGAGAPYLNSPLPGSGEWLRWFENRPGTVPMDAGSVAGDFDLALTFRVLPAWLEATTGQEHALRALDASGKKVRRDYAGKPRD